MGLDDIRDLQLCKRVEIDDIDNEGKKIIGFQVKSGPMQIYLHNETMKVLSKVFSYLVEPPLYINEELNILERRIALLSFNVIEPTEYIDINGLSIRSFPVYHGGTYISLGFSFGSEGEFVYISDVKIIPNETLLYLKSIKKIKILVLDCLDINGIYSHIGLNEALEIAEFLNPDVLYLTGMACGIGFHDDFNEKLVNLRTNTYLAYDGMVIDDLML